VAVGNSLQFYFLVIFNVLVLILSKPFVNIFQIRSMSSPSTIQDAINNMEAEVFSEALNDKNIAFWNEQINKMRSAVTNTPEGKALVMSIYISCCLCRVL
jgi:hypothetical protein